MTFIYRRRYSGPLQAVIFDWAGTTCDFGCVAPAAVFVQIFARRQVSISMAEARGPMGMAKRDHIRTLAQTPAIAGRFQAVHDRRPEASDVDAMYADFVPLQLAALARHGDLIPGTTSTVATLRARGIGIGSNTGYSAEMTRINLEAAARQGYRPDSTVCADQVPRGRPFPFMSLRNAIELGVGCVQACLKVDDTVPGIEEGLNAGMWTVGVAVSGNEVGLSLEGWQDLNKDEQDRLRTQARGRLMQAGAHFVIDTVADLIPCVDAIEARLARGEAP